MDKEQRWQKFIKEHPQYCPFTEQRLAILERKAQRSAERMERLKKIWDMWEVQKLNKSEIGRRVGLTRERIRQIIEEYTYSKLKQ